MNDIRIQARHNGKVYDVVNEGGAKMSFDNLEQKKS